MRVRVFGTRPHPQIHPKPYLAGERSAREATCRLAESGTGQN